MQKANQESKGSFIEARYLLLAQRNVDVSKLLLPETDSLYNRQTHSKLPAESFIINNPDNEHETVLEAVLSLNIRPIHS